MFRRLVRVRRQRNVPTIISVKILLVLKVKRIKTNQADKNVLKVTFSKFFFQYIE